MIGNIIFIIIEIVILYFVILIIFYWCKKKEIENDKRILILEKRLEDYRHCIKNEKKGKKK